MSEGTHKGVVIWLLLLFCQVLKESSAFEHNWKELELWLDQLLHLESSQQETVVQFLDLV